MNKNNIHFQVHRTKEGTLFEITSGLLVLMSLILSTVFYLKAREEGAGIFFQTGIIDIVVLFLLFLAYKPETFNIPDNSPAELFAVTVRFIRCTAVLQAFLSSGIALSAVLRFDTGVVAAVSGLFFAPLLCWYFYEYMKARKNKKHE